jgi:aspartate kinase
MKFGGTSVADAEAINRVAMIVRRQMGRASDGRPPVVVVSALSKVTDRLIQAAQSAEGGDADVAAATLEQLLARHLDVVDGLIAGDARAALEDAVRRDFESLTGLVRALAVLRDVSPRSLDAVVAAGELLSSRIVAAALGDRGLPTVFIDARAVVTTDAEHGAAAPDMAATRARVLEHIAPVLDRGEVPVLGGFIGSTPSGIATTLGRGGSDFSAAILGACLDADEIQIWTDVDGMLTADPRVVPEPQLVPALTFAEASELAYFGAKVLHPSTILPAVAKNIPVRILNARRPDSPGTRIAGAHASPGQQLTAIACKRDLTVVDITSTRMLMAYGFLRRVFEIFERFRTPIDVVTTSEVSVSVTIDDKRRLTEIVHALREFSDVSSEANMAIICAVGEGLRTDPTLFGRAVTALGRVPLRLVSQAASRRNITFVLRDADVPEAMTRLHEHFFQAAEPHRERRG